MKTFGFRSHGIAFVMQGSGPRALGSEHYGLGISNPVFALIFHNKGTNKIIIRHGEEGK